ncbi:hypothetical protein BHE74_00047320 [Ensete ventricosum]|nr:hypothetical protein GW17_00028112 [Ensete ventricosum]RWW46779.1 hypothetical protein BHE74_00047320 [Ensete ventricosum]RZR77516.1 hypothetical protein BHM03_00002628 [Ensete ventricosum]
MTLHLKRIEGRSTKAGKKLQDDLEVLPTLRESVVLHKLIPVAMHIHVSEPPHLSCTDLPHLGASLYYNRDASANTVSVAFKAPQTSTGWVAWGLNPNATKMVGSQAIVAFLHSNGSMMAYPTQLDSYAPSMAPAALSFPVNDVSAAYVNKEMIIFATLGLVGGGTKFNQVWQEGSTVLNDVPKAHSTRGDNIKSLATIDFQ